MGALVATMGDPQARFGEGWESLSSGTKAFFHIGSVWDVVSLDLYNQGYNRAPKDCRTKWQEYEIARRHRQDSDLPGLMTPPREFIYHGDPEPVKVASPCDTLELARQ